MELIPPPSERFNWHLMEFITLFASGLSFAGSGFVLYMYFKVKYLRTFTFKQITMLCFSDFIVSIIFATKILFYEYLKQHNSLCVAYAFT